MQLRNRFRIVCIDVTRCPLKPKNFIYYFSKRVLTVISLRETFFDVYTIQQKSHSCRSIGQLSFNKVGPTVADFLSADRWRSSNGHPKSLHAVSRTKNSASLRQADGPTNLTQFDPDKKSCSSTTKKIGYCAMALSSLVSYKRPLFCQKKPAFSPVLIRLEKMNR